MPQELNVPTATTENSGETGIGTRLRLLRMKIDKIDDPNDKALPGLLEEESKLRKAQEVKRLKKRLQAVLDGDEEEMFF